MYKYRFKSQWNQTRKHKSLLIWSIKLQLELLAMAFYKKSDCGLILGFCILAVLIVGNEALHEGYKRCRNYCHEELKASPYDCSIFCFFKCAPSMGGTGCFRSSKLFLSFCFFILNWLFSIVMSPLTLRVRLDVGFSSNLNHSSDWINRVWVNDWICFH